MITLNRFFHNNYFIFSFILLVLFVAYFFSFTKFGLYEDDYYFITNPANASFGEIIEHIKWVFIYNPEGRILGFALPYILVYLFYNIGGMSSVYLFGLIIVATNGYLLFTLMKKVFSFLPALFITLFFILSPADTTKALLIHIYQLQISVLFLLVGLHLYLNKRYIISYIIASFTLLTYETAFLPFFFAPALENLNWRDKKYLWKQVKHAVIFGLIVLLIVLSRKLYNEARLEEVVVADAFVKTILALFIGPVIAVYSYFNAIIKALKGFNDTFVFILPSFVLLFFLLYHYIKKWELIGISTLISFKSRVLSIKFFIEEDFKTGLKLSILGGIMLIFSYLFSAIHFPPIALLGRATSVHLPASISSAIFLGGLAYLLFFILGQYRLKLLFTIFISLVFSFFVGYGRLIQKDFIKSWDIQKDFWSQVLELCPDMEEGTMILVERKDLPDTDFIYSHSWADPVVLEYLFKFPETWKYKPKLIIIEKTLENEIYIEDGKYLFEPVYSFLYEDRKVVELIPGNTIYLQGENAKYSRLSDSLVINNSVLRLKADTIGKTLDYPKQNMYSFFFKHK